MQTRALDLLVDLHRYPIHALQDSAGKALVEELRAKLQGEGLCCLRGFLRPGAVERLVEEALSVKEGAYYGLTEASPYFNDHDASLPHDHPRNIRTPRELGLIAADQIPKHCGLHQLYETDELRCFLATLLEKEALYRVADPYQKVALTVIPQGAGHNWHFDDADFTITLLLRKPECGGEFECVPGLRTPTDENYPQVREVLHGRRDDVRVIDFEPGTLMVFRGRYSLHRVSPVQGNTTRLVAILSYNTEPDWLGTPKINQQVFGPRVGLMS